MINIKQLAQEGTSSTVQTDTEEDREVNSEELTYNKAERDVINQNPVNKYTADEIQELKFQVNCLHYSSVTLIEQTKVLI